MLEKRFCGAMGNYTFEHLNSINLKHYSQTCSNEHLSKQLMLSPPKQIPIQSLLCKTTICLTRLATTFLTPKWKKICLKQQLQNFIQRRNAKKKHKEQCIKMNVSLIIFTLLLVHNSKYVYKSWIIHKII